MHVWPFLFYCAVVFALVGVMFVLSHVLGERRRRQSTSIPYEGGLESAGTARVRLSARFYLVAVFFVVFDLEAVFIIAWALAARELGWAGYLSLFVFAAVLALTLVYITRSGGLDLSTARRRSETRPAS